MHAVYIQCKDKLILSMYAYYTYVSQTFCTQLTLTKAYEAKMSYNQVVDPAMYSTCSRSILL